MGKAIEQIIGFEAMLGVITAVLNGLPEDTLPNEFMTLTADNDGGNVGTYTKVNGSKETARRVAYGAPSHRINQKDITDVPVTLIHLFEHIIHKQKVLNLLRNFNNPQRQNKGQQLIDQQTGAFIARFLNSRKVSVASMLANGKIWFDNEGNILPSASGATVTVDFGVPAGNQGGLDVFGTGDIIAVPWSDVAAPIVTDVRQIRNAGTKLTGYTPGMCLHGENIMGYLTENNGVKNILQSNSNLANSFANSEIPNGFLKLDWFDVSGFHFVDASGTLQSVFDPDAIIFIPPIDRSWYEMLEGSLTVPEDMNISADALAALENLTDAFGMFSYATIETDPVSIKHLAGDTFLPVLKVDNAIFQGNATP